MKSRAIAAYMGHRIGPTSGTPGAMGLMYGLTGAAVGAAGLCGRLPLDRTAVVLLRGPGVDVQEARQACCSAAGSALEPCPWG